MTETVDSFEEFLRRVPFTWHCVKCGKDFPNHPNSEQPFAFKVNTDPKTGWQTHGGDICRSCHQSSSDFSEELKRRAEQAP